MGRAGNDPPDAVEPPVYRSFAGMLTTAFIHQSADHYHRVERKGGLNHVVTVIHFGAD